MCKLLTLPHFPSVGKLKTIFKTIFKIIFKTIFSFGIGLLSKETLIGLLSFDPLQNLSFLPAPSSGRPPPSNGQIRQRPAEIIKITDWRHTRKHLKPAEPIESLEEVSRVIVSV